MLIHTKYLLSRKTRSGTMEKQKELHSYDCNSSVGSDGFEPPKLEAADLQSAPFGHSGNYPVGWALTDSNRRPSACKADALNQLS